MKSFEIVATQPANSLVRSGHHDRKPCCWEIGIIILILESLRWVGLLSRQLYTTRAGEGLRAQEDPGVQGRFSDNLQHGRGMFSFTLTFGFICVMSLESTSPSTTEG